MSRQQFRYGHKKDFANFILSHLQSKGQTSLFFKFRSFDLVSALDLCRYSIVPKSNSFIQEEGSSLPNRNAWFGID